MVENFVVNFFKNKMLLEILIFKKVKNLKNKTILNFLKKYFFKFKKVKI